MHIIHIIYTHLPKEDSACKRTALPHPKSCILLNLLAADLQCVLYLCTRLCVLVCVCVQMAAT